MDREVRYAIGNGQTMAYCKGLSWEQIFGPPYSAPTTCSVEFPSNGSYRYARMAGTNIWRVLFEQGTFTDCAVRQPACLMRRFDLKSPMQGAIELHGFAAQDVTSLFANCSLALIVTVPPGAYFYGTYPMVHHRYLGILLRTEGDWNWQGGQVNLNLSGKGDLLITGGMDFPACVRAMRQALAESAETLLSLATRQDQDFNAKRLQHQPALRPHPLREAVLQAAEDIAFQIRAQQDSAGCVIAGHMYHLAYVRDSYGTMRGMLALGCFDEVAAWLRFYRDTFAAGGKIATAQSCCFDGVYHVHENDDSENTGYLMLSALDYLKATEDTALFLELGDMLDWALRAQLKALCRHMLPFSGDETYIAGFLMPRSVLNHGSMEATMLFYEAGRRYLSVCDRIGRKVPCRAEAEKALLEVAAHYDEHFRRGASYITNAPERAEGLSEPEFRHGVCANHDYFGWVWRADEGVYLCKDCLLQGKTIPVCKEEYALKNTLLMVRYLQSELPDGAVVKKGIEDFLSEFRREGTMISHPGTVRCLGYDPGLLLYAAKSQGIEADDLLEFMLGLRDAAGMWAEYYEKNEPKNCRCRPWESGINIEAAIRYLQQNESQQSV